MAEQPNISQILAALAQRPGATSNHFPSQNQQQSPSSYQQPSTHEYAAPYPQAPMVQPNISYNAPPPLPQPINSGRIDLSNIRPTNSGSVSFSHTGGGGRNLASEKGSLYHGGPAAALPRENDTRLIGNSYRPRRSRSRSPDNYGRIESRESYNVYRDDRRTLGRPMPGAYGADAATMRGPLLGARPSPPTSWGAGPSTERSPMPYGGPDDNSDTISINSGLVGLIIGRQGENLRRIEKDTQTRVQFITPPDAGGSERECRITGLPGAREHAKAEIYRVIQESGKDPGSSSGRAPPPADRDMGVGIKQSGNHQPALRVGEDSVTIKVPNRTVGLIIGKGGETIRDLQERSHCHVNIVGEEKSEGGLRPVNLIGTPEAAQMAKELIMDIVDTDTKNFTNLGGRVADHGLPRGSNSEKINDQIFVPSESVGMIIGKGGETIKEMQLSTGCKINVSPAAGHDVERHIGLIGSRDAIDRAKNAIMDKVRAVQQKNRPAAEGQSGETLNGRQSQSHQQQPRQQQQHQTQQDSQHASNETDPYAAYGGYQNYVALWYSSLHPNQSQQDQSLQGPPGS